MEAFEISVSSNGRNHHYEVRDYMHHSGDDKCKYEIYKKGIFVVSFEPGPHHHLSICKNAEVESEAMLDLIAEELERFNI